jgi:hypothetical protein
MPQSPNQPPIYKRNYPVYKYRELIAAVGNDTEVHNLIVDFGFDAPTKSVIRGWRTRNSVPGRWVPILLMYAVSIGAISDIRTLIRGVQVKQPRNVRKPRGAL